MRQISKQPEDLQPIVGEILEHGSDVIFHDGNYQNLAGQGFVYRIDYGQYYREQQQFEKVEQTYKCEINDLSTALGADNSIIESLKTQLSAIYFEQRPLGRSRGAPTANIRKQHETPRPKCTRHSIQQSRPRGSVQKTRKMDPG